MVRLPTQRPLLTQQRSRAKGVATMEWNRVVKDVQYAHSSGQSNGFNRL